MVPWMNEQSKIIPGAFVDMYSKAALKLLDEKRHTNV
jgi:hypothetical protein